MIKRKLRCAQMEILERAHQSQVGFVYPNPDSRLERKAVRRLEKRGLLVRAVGWPNVWRLSY